MGKNRKNNKKVENTNPATQSLPQDIVATFVNAQGQQLALDANTFGKYVSNQYTQINFPWRDSFISYYDTHNMVETNQKLIAGMDDVSKEYLNQHEVLLNLSRASSHILVHKALEWTRADHILLNNYAQIKEAKNYPFLDQVNLDWGSSFTNAYGLFDLENLVPGTQERLNGKSVIDAGGFIGDTLVLFRHLLPQSTIHSFEPSKNAYETMCNLLKSDIDNGHIVANKLALAEKKGTLQLSSPLPKDAQGASAAVSAKIKYNTDNQEEVEAITLDDYVKEHKLEVGLIKVDVEGYEWEIIKGALNTIKEQRPLLIIGAYHNPEEFYELKPYLESLNLNYRFELRRSCFTMPLADLVLVCYPL